jgi:hypothetical protein
MTSSIRWCEVCGRAWKVYDMHHPSGNPGLCGACRDAAERQASAPDTPEQIRKRREQFGHHAEPAADKAATGGEDKT